MAKRKRKLNKKVILVLVGVLVVFLAMFGYALSKRRYRWFPRDPVAVLKDVEAFQSQGNWKMAHEVFLRQLLYVKPQPAHFYQYARFELEYLQAKGKDLTEAQRAETFSMVFRVLHQAVSMDPGYLDAHRLLAELVWGRSQMARQAGLVRAEHWQDYIARSEKIVQLDPNDHATFARRGIAYAAMAEAVPGGNTENAIANLTQAAQLKSDEPEYWIGLAGVLMAARQTQQAQEAFNQALEKCPGSVELRVQYARYLQERGESQQVLEQIQLAIAAQPNAVLGYLAMADYYRLRQQPDQSLEALVKAMQVDSTDERVYRGMAGVYMVKKDIPKAIEAVRQGLEALQGQLAGLEDTAANQAARQRLSTGQAQLTLFLANTLVDQAEADPTNREAYMQEAKQLAEKPELEILPVYRDRVKGRLAFLEKRNKEAIELLEGVHRHTGTGDYTTAMTLVRLYIEQGSYGKAEELLDQLRATPAYSDSTGVLLYKAVLKAQYRNYAEALRYLDELLGKDPANKQALSLQQTFWIMTGQGDVEQLAGDTELSPISIPLLLDQAQTLWVQEARDEAIEMMEALHRKAPQDLTVSLRLLVMYALDNQEPKAREILEQTKAAHPDKVELLELQRQFLEEKDPQRRVALRMQMADMNPDPYRRAMEKALVSLAFGDRAGCETFLRQALEAKPGDRPATDQLLEMIIVRKDWEAAKALVDQAVAADLDDAGGKLYQARLAWAQGQKDTAITLLNEVLAGTPSLKAARAQLGQIYLETNQLAQADEQFRKLLEDDPSYIPAVVGIAVVTERQGETVQHAAYIERAYHLAPRDTYVLAKYLNMKESAMPAAEQIRQRERLARRSPRDWDNLARLAKLYERVTQVDRAERLFQLIYREAPEKLTAAQELVSFYARSNRSSDADKLMVEMLRTWPDKVGVYIIYGNFLRQVNAEQARNALVKATETDPNDPRGHQALALFYSDRAEWIPAAQAMERYLQLKSDDATAREQLARLQINGMQLEQASRTLEEMLSHKSGDPTARTLQAVVMMKEGRSQEALERLNEILRDNPKFSEALATRSHLQLFMGQLALAQMDLEAASVSSGAPEIAVQLASMHLQAGEKERCAMVLRELLSRSETQDYKPAQRMLMGVYLGQQRWDQLDQLIEKVKAADPYDPAVWLTEAQMWSGRGDLQRSVAALEKAIGVAPRSPVVLRDYLQGLLAAGQYQKVVDLAQQRMSPEISPLLKAMQGQALAKLNRAQEADQVFAEAISQSSGAQLDHVLAQVHQTWGAEQSLTHVNAWLASRPEDVMMYLAAGKVAMMSNNFSSAADVLKRGLGLVKDPRQRATINRELALCYYQTRQYPQAEQTYLAVLEDEANDPTSLNNLSYLYTNDLNQPDKALPHVQKAMAQAPYSPDVLDTYGWTLAKLQRPQEAETFLSRAVQGNSSSALSRYHLGWVYEQSSRLADAQRQYQSAVAVQGAQQDSELQRTLAEALQRVSDKLKGQP
jgi:tetratricopeptide (TPR) repeat protein